MNNKKTNLIIISIIVLSFLSALYLYPQLPDRVASHWNAQGQIDGYMPKFWGVFLMPAITLAIFLLFLLIPIIDPLKKNIDKFRNYFNWLIILIVVFLLYVYSLTVFWNLGYRFNMTLLMTPAVGLLFFYIGVILKHAERNWFIGIRTPWTLSSDVVWKKTHQLGAKLFKVAGIIAILGIFFAENALWFAIIPAIASSLFLLVYSYFEHKKTAVK
ncbi:MAG: hypothetical protein COY10_00845 [Candidatus Portnoybacteria bacterium CG_4_10_14_0_2_um_filter_43_36]|uniref:DUF1648 domain-containing protein n=1 Tax=Candidatus Portnoybacteria bacterium CG_4_10_14_0_2_um_filter_43_36 TaxID=1974798 RepID=A0A2M7UEV0_9BACT|nr:MAG: hypothetical protein COY10_00845 [Candidatus Portnoybacteria bacterium CG_4_10_14_0_2_um_filter_43_36]